MNTLKIAFFGTPDFAADVLRQVLIDTELPVEVRFVVTQPDRPVGRKQVMTPSPVKLVAQEHAIPVFDTFRVPRSTFQDIDLVLLYAYGALLPADILKIPRWGFWNIHPSLLPKYRGAAPIAYPLLVGDEVTGVSLMQMDNKWDHGPIIDQEEYYILPHETQELLKKRLSDIGYKLFKKNIQLLRIGKLQSKEQDHQQSTYTRMLTKQDGYVPYPIVQKIIQGEQLTETEIPPVISEYCKKYGLPASDYQHLTVYYSLYCALYPWPGLWTKLPNDKRLKITRMDMAYSKPIITRVQLEGKKEVDMKTFMSAYL